VVRIMSEQSRGANNDRPASLWVGVIIFAAGALLVSGAFSMISGAMALFDNDVLMRDRSVLSIDLTAWGWLHLGLGFLQICAAFALLVGVGWARWVAVVVAGTSALAQMAFLPVHPFGALLIISLDVLAIFAVLRRGGDISDS